MKASTRYLIVATLGRQKHYPIFDDCYQLRAWGDRSTAQRFTKREAIEIASGFQAHLKRFNAKDTVEVFPETGGMAISLQELDALFAVYENGRRIGTIRATFNYALNEIGDRLTIYSRRIL